MDDPKALAARISALGPVRAAAFAAAAADRARPLFRSFHGPTPWSAYQDATAQLWTALTSGDLDTARALSHGIERLPEAANIEGDSESREYYAAWAAEAYKYVHLILGAEGLESQVLACIYYSRDLAANIEGELGLREEANGSPIENQEADAQLTCCEILERSSLLDDKARDQLALASQAVARTYGEAIPIFAQTHGWTLDP